MKFLASQYEPDVWWSDGDWEAKPEYWGSKDFLAWLYNESPTKHTVVTNDRSVAYYVNPYGDCMQQTIDISKACNKTTWLYLLLISLNSSIRSKSFKMSQHLKKPQI